MGPEAACSGLAGSADGETCMIYWPYRKLAFEITLRHEPRRAFPYTAWAMASRLFRIMAVEQGDRYRAYQFFSIVMMK